MTGYEIFVANPIRKRRKKKGAFPMARRTRRRKAHAKRRHVYAANPIRRSRRKRRAVAMFRRNPIGRRARRAASAGFSAVSRGKGNISIQGLAMPAIAAGIGGVLADMLMGYAPLPAALKSGPVKHLSKAALSLGAGYGIAKFANKKLGEMSASGGLSIDMHDALREQVVKFAPALKFGEYLDGMGYVNSGEPVGQLGEYLSDTNAIGFDLRDNGSFNTRDFQQSYNLGEFESEF